MRMWKMRPMCHLLGLVLLAKVWQMLVAVGQTRDEEIEEEDDVRMVRRRKKYFMLKRSILPHMLT
jgi:hypothetical protein